MVILTMLLTPLNCTQNKNDDEQPIHSAQLDQIANLVSVGRNTTNSDSVRFLNLQKAYELTQEIKSDSTKLRNLSRIQWSFLGLKDSLWFRKTNKEANLLARKITDSSKIAGTLWDLGIFFEISNVIDRAYFNFYEAQKIYTVLGNSLNVGKLEYDLATIQKDAKNYTSAEVGVIRAIELLKPLEENGMLYRCYNLLGIISENLDEYEPALQYYTTAKEYLKKSSLSKLNEIQLENNINIIYEKKGDIEKAVLGFREILGTDSLYTNYPSSYARVLNNLAVSQHKLYPKNNEVEKMFLNSLAIRDSLGNNYEMAGSLYELSSYYLQKKDSAKALSNALQAKSSAESSNNYNRILESLAMLTRLDPKNSSSYGQRYMVLNDSLQNEERKTRNKLARIRFETDEVVAENQLLARQRQLWTGISAALLLLAISGFVIFIQRTKNQNLRFEQAQQKTNQEIMGLMLVQSEKVEEGKKMEQKRISEELHDGVQGRLQGSRMLLLGLNARTDEKAVNERKKAIVMLKDIQEEVRSISHELSHAAYQKIHNFILSIQELIDSNEKGASLKINLQYKNEFDWDALSGDIKINLYRIIQESIQNSIKHAACRIIDIDLTADENSVSATIADDGKGFVVKKGRKGIGMRNIASRIKKLNGTWKIESQPGKGTKIALVLPS